MEPYNSLTVPASLRDTYNRLGDVIMASFGEMKLKMRQDAEEFLLKNPDKIPSVIPVSDVGTAAGDLFGRLDEAFYLYKTSLKGDDARSTYLDDVKQSVVDAICKSFLRIGIDIRVNALGASAVKTERADIEKPNPVPEEFRTVAEIKKVSPVRYPHISLIMPEDDTPF